MNRLTQALYWPCPDDEEILRVDSRRPCKAVATEVRDGRADLTVFDDFGRSFVRLNIAVGPSQEIDRCVLA
jgi:hypothetical protein